MGCFYCDEHHEGREAIMYKVGEMEAGVLYLFKDQAHKGRCALALKNHRKELCECEPEELSAFARDLARASGAVKELWGCDKINLGDGISLPHIREEIASGSQVTVVCGGRTFKADCDVSERQRGALLAGGTLNYAKKQH